MEDPWPEILKCLARSEQGVSYVNAQNTEMHLGEVKYYNKLVTSSCLTIMVISLCLSSSVTGKILDLNEVNQWQPQHQSVNFSKLIHTSVSLEDEPYIFPDEGQYVYYYVMDPKPKD